MSHPLTPAECDLRDFPYLPIDVVRLRDSDLAATADGEVFRAAVLAWCVSWHQRPAASLPDDDAVLARLLGYGRDVRGWVKLRAGGALRGFVKCNDGRLYHPIVAEKAVTAWKAKQAQRDRTAKARQTRLSQTAGNSVTEIVTVSKGERKGERKEEEKVIRPAGAGHVPEPVVEAVVISETVTTASSQPELPMEIPAFLRREPVQVTGQIVEFVPSTNQIDKAFEVYNVMARAVNEKHNAGWRIASILNKPRISGLKARIAQAGGYRQWCDIMRRAADSDHLLGLSPRQPGWEHWRPDLDFFLQQKSFTSLMEGKYDNTDRSRGRGLGGALDRIAESAAIALAAGTDEH